MANNQNNYKGRFKRFFSKLNPKRVFSSTQNTIKRRPLVSFFVALLLLFGLIAASNLLTPKKEEAKKAEVVKSVQIFDVGTTPKLNLQAKIEKTGVIKISALAPGVVQSINVTEGQIIQKGATIVNLSSNYQGGNAASLQTAIASKQYQNTKDTFNTQKDLLRLQKEVAEKSDANADELRSITDSSLQETRDLIDLNQGIIDTLNENQRELEQNNPLGVNDPLILQLRSQRAQAQVGLNQLRSGLRQAEYQAASDKPPAQLSDVQKELAIKQLDVQTRALDLGLEVARLQVALASVNEALYYPSAPFAAKIQRVHVRVGQAVNPGVPLVTLSAVEDPINAIINLPQNLASSVSVAEPSKVFVDHLELSYFPTFISSEAIEGGLHSVIYVIEDKYSEYLTDGEYISVEIPVSAPVTASSDIPFIPLDSVFQTANESFVFVAQGEKVESRKVNLGEVFGRFVEVKSGIDKGDRVIINRNVIAGDKVKIQND